MRKSTCIQKWLDYYSDNTNNNHVINSILNAIINKPNGRLYVSQII
jgi:hypothetical protein